MKYGSLTATLLFLAGVAATPGPARASHLTLGTNLGISWVDVAGRSGTATYLAWPASVGGLQPGLRWGYVAENPHHELYLDSGLLIASGSAIRNNDFEATGNYQYNVAPRSRFSPYLTGGLGFLYTGLEFDGTNIDGISLILGGGVGARWMIADGRGAVRAEFRIDKVTQGKDHGVIVINEGIVYGLKFGFDLWF